MTMHHASDNDVVADEREVQSGGKVRNQCAPLVSLNCRKRQREVTHPFDGGVDRSSKLAPQLRSALLTPPLGLKQLALGGRPEDNRAGH